MLDKKLALELKPSNAFLEWTDEEDDEEYEDEGDEEEEQEVQEEIFQSRFGSKAQIRDQNSPSQNGTTLLSFGTYIQISLFIAGKNHCQFLVVPSLTW